MIRWEYMAIRTSMIKLFELFRTLLWPLSVLIRAYEFDANLYIFCPQVTDIRRPLEYTHDQISANNGAM
jgi:hypothetical protein